MISLHELYASGKSIREIARITGHARNTVRKYLRANGIPEPRYPKKRGSKLDPFKPFLDQSIAQGIFNCEVLLRLLREQGYTGGITLIKDYVRPRRPPRKIPAVQRYETKPGYQAQVDWKICQYIDVDGNVRKIPVFVMVLGYSRAMYIEFAKRCDIHSFLRCLIHALEYFGGVPQTMLTDRMKTVILGMGDDRRPRWHPLFEDFAATVGMIPKVCRVKRPQTKGKVERAARFIEQNFMAGRRFTDVEDLNRQARQWCDEQNRRIHGTTGERPIDRLAREPLGALPPADRLAKYRFEVRKVSRDGFVSYDGVRYGVPWPHSGREVTVRDVGGFIEIYREQQLIARHKKQAQSRTLAMCERQYANLSTTQGNVYPKPLGIRIPVQDVEVRSLEVYERLMEVGT
ncbi:MAG: integrase [Bacillus thermozeamaize]|uniref:Integrase n=1 Tax=Bacillus thermozeamaize TaxID=230954 RepID=A0A1Y3PRR3_9BACI|nr:MAG: integrase [Bacillus thermozeamaize]